MSFLQDLQVRLTSMVQRSSKFWRWTFGGIGVCGSLMCLMHFGHWREFTLPPARLLILLVFIITVEIWCRAVKLQSACSIVHKSISLRRGMWINALGDVFGALTPSSVGGDISRVAALLRLPMEFNHGVTVVAAERFSFFVSLALLLGVFGLAIMFQGRTFISPAALRYTFLLYVGFALGLSALLIGINRKKNVAWKRLLLRFNLLVLSLLHHVIRLGLLPLIAFFLTHRLPDPAVFVWSFVLGYGFTLIPIPSGGGSVEVAFMTALAPLLGVQQAGLCLVLWRLAGHYVYVISGAMITMVGSMMTAHRSLSEVRAGEAIS